LHDLGLGNLNLRAENIDLPFGRYERRRRRVERGLLGLNVGAALLGRLNGACAGLDEILGAGVLIL
jgi:hypothetical protein